jgi:hypothetical protein
MAPPLGPGGPKLDLPGDGPLRTFGSHSSVADKLVGKVDGLAHAAILAGCG